MTDKEILKRLREIVSRYSEKEGMAEPAAEINEDTLLLEELGFNSLTLLGILVDVEDAFGVLFPTESFPSLRTARDVLMGIRRFQAKKAVTYEGDGAFFRKESRIPGEELDRLPHPETVCEMLEYSGSHYAARTAISTLEEKISYADMLSRIRRNCSFLKEKGFSKGDHIAVYSQNDPEAAMWILSVMAYGGAAVLIPSMLPPQAAMGAFARFDVRGCVSSEALAEGLSALPIAVPVWKLSETGKEEGEFDHPVPEQPAAVVFTSGTSGMPKGVVLSHKALMKGAFYGILYPNPREGTLSDRRYLSAIPMTHIFGLEMGFLSFLYVGAEVCLFPDTMSAIRSMHRVKPTITIMVPGMVEMILALAKEHGPQFLGGLQTIICGGAPIPLELYHKAGEFGIEMYGGYGMTEGVGLTSGGAGIAFPPGSVGKIYPGVSVKIVDGEIWFTGDIVMNGYYKDEEETKKTLVDGWIRSGDLGYVDESGFVFVSGRVKNLIILSNGENVSPEELETLLYSCPMIGECVVRAMDVDGREVIGAELCLVPEKGTEDGVRKYVEEINMSLPSFKRIGRIMISEEPLSKTGSAGRKADIKRMRPGQ